MNYYERHIGDYLKDTAHLSLLEHGVYTRLLDVYYSSEGSIEDDKLACRLVGAKTSAEKAAVRAVLTEFFDHRDDGWHQARCDREIDRFLEGEPEREVKKANEDNRLKRHREERARLFKVITNAGQHAAWNIPMADLRALVERITATAPETGVPPFPATAPATPATATHTQSHLPSPIPQGKEKAPTELADRSPAGSAPPPEFTGENADELNGRAVVALSATWELPGQWGIDAQALGWKPKEILHEAERFRQYWTSGKGAGKRRSVKGWRQGWSNWLSKAETKP
jgi:uncharacterized protein YdaU (DUF1376 family)